METSLQEQKKYWSVRDQELWNTMKVKTNEELLNIIQEYWSDLSGDNEFYFPIQLLRKRLNVTLDEEYFGNVKESYISDGYPEIEITEMNVQ